MNSEKSSIIRLCFQFGAIFSVLAIFLPTTYTAATTTDGFASALFTGTAYGAEDLLLFLFIPPIGLTLITLLICQIRLAFKSSITFYAFWPFTQLLFSILSILLIISIGNEFFAILKRHGYPTYGDKLLIGYYFYSIG